jgi:peptidoglycan pentaglycine glycine transferase (the first glycine)
MQWNELLAALPGAHFLQTFQWAQIKAHNGWRSEYLVWRSLPGGLVQLEELAVDAAGELAEPVDPASVRSAALVLRRTLPGGGFSARIQVLYAPKGPVLDWGDVPLRRQALDDLRQHARQRRAIFIKIDPDLPLGWGVPVGLESNSNPVGLAAAEELADTGWRFSGEQVQFRNTVVVDLQPSEEELLARMKQKTRYNIRLAERKGVQVRPAGASDLDLLYEMYADTAARDGFLIRDRGYYLRTWGILLEAGLAEPLIAEVDGEPAAGVVIVRFAGQAWYYNGMSRPVHREKMPSYLLQWEAMRRAKRAGCRAYDLWGAPDAFVESDPLWGVYRFKEGLGGQVVRTLGAYDYPVNGLLYSLYTQALPRLLGWLRSRRR